MNSFKFWRSISFWFTLIFSLLALFFVTRSVITDNTKYQNKQFSVLSQNIIFGEKQNYNQLLKGNSLTFEFKAKYNNFGEVELLFNNFGKVNNDQIIFRLKEKNSKEWYYQNKYPTSLMDSAQFFPFGFPVIKDSQEKIYVVSLESINGKINDSVSISDELNFFQAKYLFSKSFLINNKREIIGFLINKVKNSTDYFSNKDWLNIISSLFLPFLLWLTLLKIFLSLDECIKDKFTGNTKRLLNNKFILVIVGLSILTRIQFLGYSQYWDASTYWYYFLGNLVNIRSVLLNHGNIIKSLIENLNILGHPSMGYIFWMSLGQLINKGDVVIFNIQNMILAILAILAFYRIVKYFFPKNRLENYLITFIFAFNPLFYATSISFNLDFPVLVFEVLMISALLYKKYFWFFIWSFFLIFSKETGVLVYFSFLPLFYLLFIKTKLLKFNKNNILQILSFSLPTIIFGLYMFFTRGKIWSSLGSTSIFSGSLLKCELSSMFCFKFSMSNIQTIVYEMFKMNFSWIMTIIILISFAVWLRALILKQKRQNLLSKDGNAWLILHILTFAFFVIFNLLFFVMPFPRYVVAGVYFLILIFYLSLNYVFINQKNLRVIILIVLSILTFIQVFKSLDPYASLSFSKNFWQKGFISPSPSLRDAMVYNSQFVSVDKLEKKVATALINSSPVVIDLAAEYFFKDIKYIGTVPYLEGFKKDGLTKLTYIYFPWFTNREISLGKISKYYQPTLSKVIESGEYSVEIYNLEAI